MQAAAAPSRSALELNDAAAKLPADAEALPLPLYLIYSQLLSVEVRRARRLQAGSSPGSGLDAIASQAQHLDYQELLTQRRSMLEKLKTEQHAMFAYLPSVGTSRDRIQGCVRLFKACACRATHRTLVECMQRFGDSGAQLSVVEAPLAEAADAAATEPAEPSGDATMADDGEIRQPEAPAPQVRGSGWGMLDLMPKG